MNVCLLCGAGTSNVKYCSKTCANTANNAKVPKRKLSKRCVDCDTLIQANRVRCVQCGEAVRFANRTIGFVRARAKFQPNAEVRNHARQVIGREGREQICASCSYDKHVEVAHNPSINTWPDDTLISVINASEHLFLLCPNCHWELDYGEAL